MTQAGVTTIISTGITGVIALILGSNPVGWAVVGVAVGAGYLTDLAYENDVLGIKTGTEATGIWLDANVFTPVGQTIVIVGKTVSNTWNSMWSW